MTVRYVLVKIETSAPADKVAQVDMAVARAVYRELKDGAECHTLDRVERITGSVVDHFVVGTPIVFNSVADDGNL